MANGTNGGSAQQKGAPVQMRPFVAGTRYTDENVYDQTVTIGGSAVDYPALEINPNGFLAGLFMLVECTASSTTASVAATVSDSPWSSLDTVTLNDVNNQPLVGPMGGYDIKTLNKYGGYAFQDDPQQSPIFSAATTGTGATAGSFTYALYVPVEITHRDAVGSLPNKNAASTFRLTARAAATSAIYSTAPDGAITQRLRVTQVGWQDPDQVDLRGNPVAQNPPAVQSTQYWSKQTYVLSGGAINQRLQNIDGLLRNLVFIARDENNNRFNADSEFPDPFTLQYETAIIVNRLRTLWRHYIARDFGYSAAVAVTNGRDYGVYPLPFTKDFGLKPGDESKLGYLPVSAATNLVISGTIGGSGANNYTVLVNRVIPANGDPKLLTGGK